MVRGRSSGKDVEMTLKNSLREMLLNWLVKSKKIAAHAGNFLHSLRMVDESFNG